MKKVIVIVMVCMFATVTFAHGPYRSGNSGVRLAADIINLVNSGLRVLTGQPRTVIVNHPTTVVTQPIVYPQQTVIYQQPQPVVVNQYQQCYYRNTPKPPPRKPANKRPKKRR